jgi:hypothetical protein
MYNYISFDLVEMVSIWPGVGVGVAGQLADDQ